MKFQVILGDADNFAFHVATFDATDHDDLRRQLDEAFRDPEWWASSSGLQFVAAIEGDRWIGLRDTVRTELWFLSGE